MKMNHWLHQLKRRTKHGWQYGLSFSSLNVPLLSWHWQNEHTKCSGWYLRYIAVMQRPVTGLWHPAHNDPRCAWKCVSQYGRPSCSKKLPLPNGTRHSCTTANTRQLPPCTILYVSWHVSEHQICDRDWKGRSHRAHEAVWMPMPVQCTDKVVHNRSTTATAFWRKVLEIISPEQHIINCCNNWSHCKEKKLLPQQCRHYSLFLVTHSHTSHFNSHLKGEPGLAGYPLNLPSSFIPPVLCILSVKPNLFISSLTHRNVFLRRPICLISSTSIILQCLIQSVSSLCSTYPKNLIYLLRIFRSLCW